MTSEEFHGLVEKYTDPSANDVGDAPLTLARLAELERQKGVKFPAFYKELLSMYGAGDFGYVTVLSPDPQPVPNLGNGRAVGEQTLFRGDADPAFLLDRRRRVLDRLRP